MWLVAIGTSVFFPFQNLLAQASVPNAYNFPDLLGGVTIPQFIERLILTLLTVVGILFFVLFLWGGVQWLIAGGDADHVKKARTTLVNAVIGLLIIAAAYAITTQVIDVIVAGKTGTTQSKSAGSL
jgi:hypothetical protein